MRRIGTTLVLAAALGAPAAMQAQEVGNGFLFGAPVGALTLRGGWAGASAHSDLFDFTTSTLTLDHRDFSSPEFGGDLSFRVKGNTHVVFSSGISGIHKRSEFRGYLDNNDRPIEQVTTFRRIPVTLTVKQYLTAPGRSIGRLAWIPSRAAAYVGAGGGAQYYRFQQSGDFIDFQTMDVFPDQYTSDGWASLAHALAGFDYTLTPEFALTTEARYVWSSARLSRDFSGFHPLDLSGFSTSVGITIRY